MTMQRSSIFWFTLLLCVVACCVGAGASQGGGDAMELETAGSERELAEENQRGDLLEIPETGDTVPYIGPGAGSTFSVAYHPSLLYLIAGILLLLVAGGVLYAYRRRCGNGDGE